MKHAQLLLSITFGIVFSCITTVNGQTVQLATVAEQLSLQRSNGSFEEYPIFSKSKAPDPSDAYQD